MSDGFGSSRVHVERVRLRGPGAVILTGPSSCGKGQVAAALCRVVSIRLEAHLSMGDILRNAITRARTDPHYARRLANVHRISGDDNVFDCVDTTEELTEKVRSHVPALEAYFQRAGMDQRTSQLEWLEFCTMNGL